jgi:hypothetical protein
MGASCAGFLTISLRLWWPRGRQANDVPWTCTTNQRRSFVWPTATTNLIAVTPHDRKRQRRQANQLQLSMVVVRWLWYFGVWAFRDQAEVCVAFQRGVPGVSMRCLGT